MKVKKIGEPSLPKYPSRRQHAESAALAGLASLGLMAMTSLGNPTDNEEPSQRLRGEMPVSPSITRTLGKIRVEPATTNRFDRITYTVKSGDTLSSLAKQYLGSADRWQEIVAINPGLTAKTMKTDRVIMIPKKSSAAPEIKK